MSLKKFLKISFKNRYIQSSLPKVLTSILHRLIYIIWYSLTNNAEAIHVFRLLQREGPANDPSD